MSELTPVEAKIEELEARLAAMTLNYHGARDMAVHAEFDRDHYELVKQQLVTTTADLEAQRTATYQAVAREHAAKRELAEKKENQP